MLSGKMYTDEYMRTVMWSKLWKYCWITAWTRIRDGMPVHQTQILTIDRIEANPAPIGTGFLLR